MRLREQMSSWNLTKPEEMTDKEEKKSDIRVNYKAVVIIVIILVSTQIIGVSGGYQYLGETFQEIPVSMVESSMSIQCQKAITEYNDFKEFLDIGDYVILPESEKMSWSDFQKYTQLKTKIRELNC